MEPCTQVDKMEAIHDDLKELKDMYVEDRVRVAKLETKVNFFTPIIAVLFSVLGYLAKKVGLI